jgi:hypothetical protein
MFCAEHSNGMIGVIIKSHMVAREVGVRIAPPRLGRNSRLRIIMRVERS